MGKGKSKTDRSNKKSASKAPENKNNCDSAVKIKNTVATTTKNQESNDIESSNTLYLHTARSAEEEMSRLRRDFWQATKEELTSVPTLIKPTITPMDEKKISKMAEMMMKNKGDRGGQNSQKLKSSKTFDKYQNQTKVKTPQSLKSKCEVQNYSKKSGAAKAKRKAVKIFKAGMINDTNDLKQLSTMVQTAMTSRDEKTAVEIAKENQKEKYIESNRKATVSGKKHNVPEVSKYQVNDLHKRGKQQTTYGFKSKALTNSSNERCFELANNTEYHSSVDKQVESKSSANKPLKAKSGLSVPIKRRFSGGTPTRKSNFTIPVKKASRAIANVDKEMLGDFASDKSIRTGIDKLKSACDVSRRDLVTNIHINCQPVLTEKGASVSTCASTSSEVDDSYPESRNNTSVQKHSKGKSNGNSTVGVEYTLHEQTPHSTLKCSDGQEELEEIISSQEASEILADSFITNTKMQEYSTDQTYNGLKNSTDEKSSNLLVPRNVMDKMQLDEVFKNGDVKSEG